METPNTHNPFSDCRIVGTVERDAYCRSEHPRGHAEFAMSRGELMEFNRCPHRWFMGYKSDETRSTEWGTLLDCLALTPERFTEQFAVTPAEYPATPKRKDDPTEMKPWNNNATFCREWAKDHDGKTIVKPDLATEALAAVKVLMADEQIKALFECSRKQVMVVGVYHDEETGLRVPVKGLLDAAPNNDTPYSDSLADLKTCTSASPFPWVRAVHEHGYHVQGKFYLDLWNAATGEERTTFLHVLQENYAPWEVGKRILSQEFLELGRLTYVAALKRYCRCLSDNVWPGYDAEGKMILNGWNLTEPEAWMIGKL